MLEITSTGESTQKELTVKDHNTGEKYIYKIRKAGAGESLKLSQYGREVTKLEKKENKTVDETSRLEDLSIKLLQILLNLYMPQSPEAKEYLDVMSVEDLSGGIEAVFSEDRNQNNTANA